MGSYSILIKPSAAKEIEALGTNRDRQRIVARIRALAQDPRPAGSEQLSGKAFYRVRQGQYRIVYEVEDDILMVHVVRVGHRSDVYK